MSQKEMTREITEPVEAEGENCATAAHSQLNIAPAEQRNKRYEIPAEIFQKLKECEADLKKWNKSIKDTLTGLKSQLIQNKAENENILAEICTLGENEKVLTQKKKTLTAELARIQSFIEKKHEKIRKLKQKLKELDWWVDDAVYDKETQMRFMTIEMETEIKSLQAKLHNLQQREKCVLDQNSCVTAELIQVQSQRDKLKKRSSELTGAVKDLKYEIGKTEYVFVKSEDQIKKLNRIITDKQDPIDDLNGDREIKSQITQDLMEQPSLLQEEKILADSEEMMMNPVEETPPNSVSCFPSTKCLFKVGLGVAVGGLLIYSAFRVISASNSQLFS